MTTAMIKPSRAPKTGDLHGFTYIGTLWGYEVRDAAGTLVKIEQSATTAAPLTNAQRAQMWITAEVEKTRVRAAVRQLWD